MCDEMIFFKYVDGFMLLMLLFYQQIYMHMKPRKAF